MTRPTSPLRRFATICRAGAGWLALLLALTGLACGGLDMEGGGSGSSSGPGGSGTGFTIGSGTFDPDQIYLYGTIGGCSKALAPVAEINTVNIAFLCGTSGANLRIDPFDSSLLYHVPSSGEGPVYQWVPDAFGSGGAYPTDPQGNDPLVATPCPDATSDVVDVMVSADGELFYDCGSHGSGWYDEGGVLVLGAGPEAVLFGVGDLVLIRGTDPGAPNLVEYGIHDLSTGITTPVPGPVQFIGNSGNDALRSLANGFWVATEFSGSNDELWELDASGASTLVGVYPVPPVGFTTYFVALDASGNLYRLGRILPDVEFLVIRAAVGDSAWTIVRDEMDDPAVKYVAGSPGGLVTGP